jgi:co-chaperonin GroES (HSP10)
MKITAFNNWIVFRWLDSESDKSEMVLKSGIVVQRKRDKKRARWGEVIAVGPTAPVRVGQYIMPEKTYGWDSPYIQQVEGGMCYLDGPQHRLVTLYKTKEEWCLFVTDDIKDTYSTNDDYEAQAAIDIKDPNNWAAGCKID